MRRLLARKMALEKARASAAGLAASGARCESVVTHSVPPMTVVQGNPVAPVAVCGVPLGKNVSLKNFLLRLKPVPPVARQQETTEKG